MENQKKLELTLCGIKPYNAKWTDPRGIVRDLTALNLNFAKNPHLHSLDKLTEPILEGGLIPIDYFEIGDDDNYSFEFDSGNVKLIRTLKDIAKKNIVFDVQFLPFAVVEKLKEWHFNIYSLDTEYFIEKSTTDLTTNYKEYNKPSVIEEKFCQCNPNRNLDTSTYLVCKECDKKL